MHILQNFLEKQYCSSLSSYFKVPKNMKKKFFNFFCNFWYRITLIIVRLKGGTFLFLGGQRSPMTWLFYTACMGVL